MFTYKLFSFLLFLSVAKSEVDIETMCRNDYRTLTNIPIEILKYCSDHLCIEKCCGEGEILHPTGTCLNTKTMFEQFNEKFKPMVPKLASEVDYSKISLFSWDGVTKNKSKKVFIFVKNHRDVKNCTSEYPITNDFFILEDGSLRMQDTGGSKSWYNIPRLKYCIDFKLTQSNRIPVVKLLVREYNAEPNYEDIKTTFVLVGLLLSSFFLILVLVVYSVLPKLQNLIGLVLIAYTVSILITFLIKIVLTLSYKSLTSRHCKIITPMLYFTALSSFFWLNIMSFDVWWSLRGHRKRRDINRRGERVKFMWYCLYAWGAPLLMTAIVTILDNTDLSNLNIIKPPIDDCFVYLKGVQLYFFTPIGVIIFVNIILFSLTVYNIWMIKRAVHRCQDSGSSKQDTNRFATYIKLAVVMGVSWCLELIPSDLDLGSRNLNFWFFILTNTNNLLVGVAIFFLFVFNKQIFVQLCKRFNIKKDFIKSLEVSQVSRSGTTKRTSATTTKYQAQEMSLLKDCAKE